jgi:hypothetical protein
MKQTRIPRRLILTAGLMVALLTGGVVSSVVGFGVPGSSAATKPAQPTLKEAYRLLVRNAGVSIVTNETCLSVKEPGDTTIADYLATLAARQSDDSINWHTEVRNKAVGANWETSIMVLGSDTADNYDMGVRVVIDGSTRRMVRGSFQCVGTS